MYLLRGRSKQANRRLVVRLDAEAVGEHVPELRHGVRVALRGSLREVPIRSRAIPPKSFSAHG